MGHTIQPAAPWSPPPWLPPQGPVSVEPPPHYLTQGCILGALGPPCRWIMRIRPRKLQGLAQAHHQECGQHIGHESWMCLTVTSTSGLSCLAWHGSAWQGAGGHPFRSVVFVLVLVTSELCSAPASSSVSLDRSRPGNNDLSCHREVALGTLGGAWVNAWGRRLATLPEVTGPCDESTSSSMGVSICRRGQHQLEGGSG